MKLTESHLRRIIRQELKEMNFGHKGEAAIDDMFQDYEALDDLLEIPMTYQEMETHLPSGMDLAGFLARISADGYTIKNEGGGKVSIQSPVYGGGGMNENKKRR